LMDGKYHEVGVLSFLKCVILSFVIPLLVFYLIIFLVSLLFGLGSLFA